MYRKGRGFGVVAKVERDGLSTVVYENSPVEDHGISLTAFEASFVSEAEGVEIESRLEKERQSEALRKKLLDLIEQAIGDPVATESRFFSDPPDEDDLALIDIWLREQEIEHSEPERMRLLSARQAERAVASIAKKWGLQVTDVSIQQVTDPSCNDWRDYDLRIGDECIDVKNARRSARNRNSYVSHCVPRFKESRRGDHVKIAGVLSDWLTLDELRRGGRELQLLGFTSMGRIEQVAHLLQRDSLDFFLDIGEKGPKFLPPWVFEYPDQRYSQRSAGLAELRRLVSAEGLPASLRQTVVVPAFLAGQFDEIPSGVLKDEWQEVLVHLLHERIQQVGLSLPMLFLTLVEHFIAMLRTEDAENYQPHAYRDLVLLKEEDQWMKSRPLFIHDPTRTIDTLIESLMTLWHSRHDGLVGFRSFRLTNLNVLEGRPSARSPWRTVLAYCGGSIETARSSRPCGTTPLVFGSCKSCECGKLICPSCGFCSQICDLCKPRQQEIADARRAGLIRSPDPWRPVHRIDDLGADDMDVEF